MDARSKLRLLPVALAALLLLGVASACGGDDGGGGSEGALSGRIQSDGSSTVGPFTTLAAERFQRENSDVQVTVGISGTGGGFERFCAGETDISNASRPIKDEEKQACQRSGVDYVEFQVVNDALTIVINPENDWANCLTVAELNEIWKPGSNVDNWSQVRSGFPDQGLELFGAGTDSGTFDYFTDEINGEEGASRSDYTASEDDNVTVQGVAGSEGGLGYFGLSYYNENQDRLKALEVDGGEGCVAPSVATAQSGEYTPLSRPLFIYVKQKSFSEPHVRAFVEYALDDAVSLAEGALYVPLTDEQLQREKTRFEEAVEAVDV